MFLHHYSFLGLDPRGKRDRFCNYFKNARNATLINRAYCIENPENHKGYGENSWGLTASTIPRGYRASAPSPERDFGTIAPTAALGSFAYTPKESLAALKHFYYDLGDKIWGRYGFVDAFCMDEEWYPDVYLAIDQGPIIVMMENHRTGLCWDYFMMNPEIEPMLKRTDWTEDTAEELPRKQTANVLETQVTVSVTQNHLVYLPKDYDSSDDSWPLMLFLHGAGERGNDIEKVKLNGPPMLVEQGQEFPFIIVSPQCPEKSWWSSDVELETLNALLDDLVSTYSIDETRIYLTGLSMGGFGAWALAAKYPERFAALAPVCGGGDPETASRLAHLPQWVFHGDADTVIPIEKSQEMVDALKQLGNDATFTIYPGVGHDSWTQAYETAELYDWFLAQRCRTTQSETNA
jgi:pimeloyl-ACP methyl ester carboxylesterase